MIEPKLKQARMKMEVRFARDSSTTLPRVDPLFKIQITQANKKRRDKIAIEFGICKEHPINNQKAGFVSYKSSNNPNPTKVY